MYPAPQTRELEIKNHQTYPFRGNKKKVEYTRTWLLAASVNSMSEMIETKYDLSPHCVGRGLPRDEILIKAAIVPRQFLSLSLNNPPVHGVWPLRDGPGHF